MRHNYSYSTITSKGQVTIPMNIRNKLNLTAGSKIEFILQDGCMIVMPINNTLLKLKGILPKPSKPVTCEEMNDIVRGRHDRS
jgi:AbrB family looped-hinge helix DNA binding protein